MSEAQRNECPVQRLVRRHRTAPALKKNDRLQTPEWVWRSLGPFDLDPCAAPDTAIGTRNFVLERGQDGLQLSWEGFVWCNPPFSQKELWAERMIAHGNGLLILPERGSAPWFAPLAVAAGAYWVMGKKINFIGGPSSNNLGSVIFPFGHEAWKRLLHCELPEHFVGVLRHRPRVPSNTEHQRVASEAGHPLDALVGRDAQEER